MHLPPGVNMEKLIRVKTYEEEQLMLAKLVKEHAGEPGVRFTIVVLPHMVNNNLEGHVRNYEVKKSIGK